MEEADTVDMFVKSFTSLSRQGRKEAIKRFVGVLDSDEMDMVIEAIDSKIDAVARQTEMESLEDSGVSSISPSETMVRIFLKKYIFPIIKHQLTTV